MLKTGMYVRCSIDIEDPSEPRDFISGRIVEVNDFSETAKVSFLTFSVLKSIIRFQKHLNFRYQSFSTVVSATVLRQSTAESGIM